MDLHTDSTAKPADLDLVVCPECAAPAVVEWREGVAGAWGRSELAKIRCLNRHWFLMPSERLVLSSLAPARPPVEVTGLVPAVT